LRVFIALLILIVATAINLFAVKFGVEDTRPFVRYTSVASGCLAIVCAIATPGAFLRFLLTGDTLALTSMFIAATAIFTSVSFALCVAIAVRLQRNAA
jgi:energy-converting hydrogenase Eha subunit H